MPDGFIWMMSLRELLGHLQSEHCLELGCYLHKSVQGSRLLVGCLRGCGSVCMVFVPLMFEDSKTENFEDGFEPMF